jgi:hypothetical protein
MVNNLIESIQTVITENYHSFHPHKDYLGALLYKGLSYEEKQYVQRKYQSYWDSLNDAQFFNALTRWYVEGVSQEGFKVFDLFPAQTRNLVNYLLTKDISYIYSELDWSNTYAK